MYGNVGNFDDNYTAATTTTDKSMGFNPNAIYFGFEF